MSTNKKIYLAGPFFSPEQIERLDKVAALLAQNPTVETESIFRPNQHSYSEAEFGSLNGKPLLSDLIFAKLIKLISL